MAEVVVTPEAQAQAEELPAVIQLRVIDLVRRLEHWPAVSGAKPLRGILAGYFRMRTGDYRLQFRVEQTRKTIQVEKPEKKKKKTTKERTVIAYRVVVEKMGHRDRFYED